MTKSRFWCILHTMNEIKTEYDEKALIRKEEMELLWGPGKIPPQKLIDYWHKTLKTWLGEYTGQLDPNVVLPTVTNFDGLPLLEPGSIVCIKVVSEKDANTLAVLLSRKEKNKEAVWLCCPISKYDVPATMWEFECSTKAEEPFIAQTWNIITVKEEELEKVATSPGANVAKDTHFATKESLDMIIHAFERMANHQFQDLPMMSVGPRIFRMEDPRRAYQREESEKFNAITHAGEPSKEEIQKIINERARAAVEKEFTAPKENEAGKQEPNQ